MSDETRTTENGAVPAQWNGTDRTYDLNRLLHNLIEDTANNYPDRVALVMEEEEITYHEMNRISNKLAAHLIERGVGAESIVAVCMNRSLELPLTLLAILKAGGAYLPLDPSYPAQRIETILKDANPVVVVVDKGLTFPVSSVETLVVSLDTFDKDFGAYGDANPDVHIEPFNATYVIYTSGSTGTPKGVVNIHRGIVNRLLWMQECFCIGENDAILQKTPYTFDVSVWEFFWPLIAGARLVMAIPNGHRDPEYLVGAINRYSITTLHFVPSMLVRFLDAEGLEKLHSLKRVMCSGEALPKGLADRFFQKIPTTRLFNLYGPTEAAVDVTWWECERGSDLKYVPIGRPVANTQIHILDDNFSPVAIGETGELYIGGVQVARGYLNRPELTRERFVRDPFSQDPDARLYRSGDHARYASDGSIEYIGRIDNQVKVRGLRIELGEIEQALLMISGISEAAAVAKEDARGEKRLVAYIVTQAPIALAQIRSELAVTMPDYMIPELFVFLPSLPLSSNGKVDRSSLPDPDSLRADVSTEYSEPRTPLERLVASVWCTVLRVDRVGVEVNFFEAGGNSLLALEVVTELRRKGFPIGVVDLFAAPTVEKIASLLVKSKKKSHATLSAAERASRMRIGRFANLSDRDGVAIVGMAGRFPGASSLEELWKNLCEGRESITWFGPDDIDPLVKAETRNDPDYLPARGIIDDADKFDAPFFGISPREAEVMDPQQRVFLELAWSALENAGYDSERYNGKIGVYAGCGDNHYYTTNVLARSDLVRLVGRFVVEYCNQKDYIATRAAYALNLTGPAVSASTGCSTTLLAVDNAFKALLDYECDMALAGGVDISIPQRNGHIYEVGGPLCKDGHCRPFDAEATGTMFCDGAGVVVLKRLSDALDDGDTIYAVIRGSAKNNDGSDKVSFLAPSVNGQSQVIELAQEIADIHPEDIDYIEAHGTATPVGDPIEIEALSRVFRRKTNKKQFCYIGSIKGNIGHPTIAAGVAGLIKVALSLYHEKIPATLHFKKANPNIDFENSPFKVADSTTEWPRGERRRIAGISSFGFGGTNVHTYVEEAPVVPESSLDIRPRQLLLLSAKTEAALASAKDQMAQHCEKNPEANLADIAYTLQLGRRHFSHRAFAVCSDSSHAAEVLLKPDPLWCAQKVCTRKDPEIVFMFPGQGAQYINMGKSLYEREPVFRDALNSCCDMLIAHLECDLRTMLFPASGDENAAQESLKNTFYTQPAIFTIEYSLSKLWESWGVRPSVLVGHSIGEFVCATLAGVMELPDALRLIALRGKLMQALPRGTMLSVRSSAALIEPRLPPGMQLAATNGPQLCVVAGPNDLIEQFSEMLESEKIVCRPLHTSHAFHSSMMDPIVEPFTDAVRQISLNSPAIPIMSTVNGTWMAETDAADPAYWGRHLRSTVRFSESINELLKDSSRVLLEVGPRTTLATLARQHFSDPKQQTAISSLADTHEASVEYGAILKALGELWLSGVNPDWNEFYNEQQRRRVPIPTYPFARKRYWAEVSSPDQVAAVQKLDSLDKEIKIEAAGTSGIDALMQRAALIQTELFKETGIGIDTMEEKREIDTHPIQSKPPMPGARLGFDPTGRPAWYLTESDSPAKHRFLGHVASDTIANKRGSL